MLVLALFFCSGATALVYEVIWSRYLGLMLGSTVQAQTVVLAVFMGGLAIGNRLFGKRSASFENPLLVYGVLEMIIGIYAFFFSRLYYGGDAIFIAGGSKIADAGVLLFAWKLLISVALLLLPTILMGGTLPLIATWIQRRAEYDTGARVGIFYAVNSLGAVTGAGLAGFALVQRLGMVSSLELTGLVNVFLGLLALVLGKRDLLLASSTPVPANPAVAAAPPVESPIGFGLLVAMTGGISMGLEVLYARALALIVGGSLQAFALVLMSFILGIGLGSVAISSFRFARTRGLGMIYALLIGAACWVVVNVMFIEVWTVFYSKAKFGLANNVPGYYWHQFGIALLAFIILGVPAALLGSVVPLSIRLLDKSGLALGDQVGRLLTWNTIGAVCGVLLTGFILMPLAGLRGALATLACLLFGIAAYLSFQRQQTRLLMVTVSIAVLGFIGIASTGQTWRQVLGAGVFRIRRMAVDSEWLRNRLERTELLYYKDSADATVAVERGRGEPESNAGQTILRINGKTDASSFGDLSTQMLLAHLPIMAKPDATNAFVLGFGSGITAGCLLGHPIQQITIAENCGPVLEASVFFQPWNRGVLTNERVRVFNEDARAVLKLRPDNYDVIISEPSNPWVVGIGSVFSKEFYELAASRLSKGGIMAQWFHKYEMSDQIVMLVIRTFAAVFPHVELWDPQDGDLILLGSMTPWESNPAQYQKVFERPIPRGDLAAIQIRSAVVMWGRQIASQKTAFALPGDGPIQTDEFPLLEYNAPRAFFLGGEAEQIYEYDERTMQFPLIDQAKLNVLRALPEQVVVDMFNYSGSGNTELRNYLGKVLDRIEGKPAVFDPGQLVVFRRPESFPEMPPVATNASPEYRRCLELTFAMLRDDSKWKESCDGIEQVLIGLMAQETIKRPSDLAPNFFAAIVARFSIRHGEYMQALRALKLGFVFNSNDPQLLYLSRVMDRLVDLDTIKAAAAAPMHAP